MISQNAKMNVIVHLALMQRTTLKTWTSPRKTMCPTHNLVSAAGEEEPKSRTSKHPITQSFMGCDRTVDGTETMPPPPPVLGSEVHSPCPDTSVLVA